MSEPTEISEAEKSYEPSVSESMLEAYALVVGAIEQLNAQERSRVLKAALFSFGKDKE